MKRKGTIEKTNERCPFGGRFYNVYCPEGHLALQTTEPQEESSVTCIGCDEKFEVGDTQ